MSNAEHVNAPVRGLFRPGHAIFFVISVLGLLAPACRVEDDYDPAPPGFTDGISVTLSAGSADPTAADVSGGDELCDPAMAQFDCFGLAQMMYCRVDQPQTCTTFPLAGPGSDKPEVGCVGPGTPTNTAYTGLPIMPACGMWATINYDYANPGDPIVMDNLDRCQELCELALSGGFGAANVTDPNGTIWSATNVVCVISSGSWSAGLDGPGLLTAMAGCGFPEEQFPFPEPQIVSGEPVACGANACAMVECDDYYFAVAQASSNTNTSQKKITASLPKTQVGVLVDAHPTLYCSNGRYSWSSVVSRSRFIGLGVGDLYYKLGFRNNDRILSVWKFNPATNAQVGSAYTVNNPLQLFDAYDALVTLGSANYIAIKLRRGTADWVVYLTSA